MNRLALSVALTVFSLSVAGAGTGDPAAGEAAVPPGAVTVLDGTSYLRFHVTKRKTAAITPAYLGKADRTVASMMDADPQNQPPPEGWTGTDFDDGSWTRDSQEALSEATRIHSAILSLRGKFAVADPAAVKDLYLTLKYRGGVIVHLNGTEVARNHVPAGQLRIDTEAEAYPEEAWVGADGKVLASATKAKDADYAARVAKRDRSLGLLRLPVSALRKGVNVLAIQIRRSPYNAKAQQWFEGHIKGRGAIYFSVWKPLDLLELNLQAVGSGVVPNRLRPEGIQVWTPDINDRLGALDYGDTTESPLIRIVGAGNGSFSGQIAVGSAKPIAGLKVVPGELKGPGGALIPVSRVRVSYGEASRLSAGVPYFDGLLDAPPAEVPVREYVVTPAARGKAAVTAPCGATQLIHLRVDVPRDAAAGDYRGEAAVSAAGLAPVKVPVELHVAGWTLPDPQQFRTFISLYQSPTSVALQYNVPMWSEEHWNLLEKSWALLGRAGNKVVNVEAIEKTQFGNEQGMITFVEKPGGGYDYDLSVMERYLDLAAKYCGKIEHVGLQVWISTSMRPRAADQECTVTVRDAKTGALKSVQVPTFGSQESRKFWKPLLDRIQEKLVKRGLPEALCLGSYTDDKGLPAVNKAFDEIWPGGGPARWWRGGHIPAEGIKPYPAAGGGLIVLHEHCYGMSPVTPLQKFPPIWSYRECRNPGVAFFRDSNVLTMPLLGDRVETLRGVACEKRGMGRIGLDWFRVIKRRTGGPVDVYNRWPNSEVAARRPYQACMAWAGPDGAASTVRFENYLEGIEEVEALMVISEAADQGAAKIGPELEKKCRDMLRDSLWRMWKAWEYCDFEITMRAEPGVHLRGNQCGWQDVSRRIYDLAAEVSARNGGRR